MPASARKIAEVSSRFSRDEYVSTVRYLITALGGPAVVSGLVGRSVRQVKAYSYGEAKVPAVVARRLWEEADRMSLSLLAARQRATEIEALGHERSAARRLAARERYYARFGRYPVPARGNKTP